MRRTKVVLFPEGARQTVVDLGTWDFPDLTVFALMTNEPQLMKAITEVQEALTAAIAAVRQGRPLPQECFVPDLWHYREEFAHDEGMELFDHVSPAFGSLTISTDGRNTPFATASRAGGSSQLRYEDSAQRGSCDEPVETLTTTRT